MQVGFPIRDPIRLRHALDHTHTTLWIRATASTRWARENQLIGFGRATSDGALTATIWDVAINPSWQRVGLGRALVERLVLSLCDKGIPTITLYAEPNVVKLYEKLGFTKDAGGIRGMAFQKTSSEGGALIAAACVASSA
jgi:ribosomal protein S18 acetylase RimI-like enzyme